MAPNHYSCFVLLAYNVSEILVDETPFGACTTAILVDLAGTEIVKANMAQASLTPVLVLTPTAGSC